MTFEEKQQKLGEVTRDYASLLYGDDTEVTLDGTFTAEQLKQIAAIMEAP